MYKRRLDTHCNAPEIQVLLSVEEAAAAMSVGKSLMYELVRRNEIASIKVGRARRVLVSALDAYVNRQLMASGEGVKYGV